MRFGTGGFSWSLRDFQGRVLREFRPESNRIQPIRDHIYRGSAPLATVTVDENDILSKRHHQSLDHLGSPRYITDGAGNFISEHKYYPFGEEATRPAQDELPLKFTGHERDFYADGEGDDLDYMHARFCDPRLGRFLSVDPVLGSAEVPQSWNRYAYVQSNPLKFVDPSGQVVRVYDENALEAIRGTLPEELRSSVTLTMDGLIAAGKLAEITSQNPNFLLLKEAVNQERVFHVRSDSGVHMPNGSKSEFFFQSREELITEMAPHFGGPEGAAREIAGPSLMLGIFNPPEESGSGNAEVIISNRSGAASTAPIGQISATMAHELLGHALRWSRGQPWRHDHGGNVDRAILEIQERTSRMYKN